MGDQLRWLPSQQNYDIIPITSAIVIDDYKVGIMNSVNG